MRRDYPEESGRTQALFAAAPAVEIVPYDYSQIDEVIAKMKKAAAKKAPQEAALTKALFAAASTTFECEIFPERETWKP